MSASRFATLEQWLAWQEGLHPKAIDLGLERVREVAGRLDLDRPPYTVITVGGTNGKGSCVAFLEAMLRAAGYRVGAYTSPHLLRYNERIRVDGRDIDDTALCRAFARVDAARGAISLTYFEFGTLAALDIFQSRGIEAAVLEVGLGGRLDAVNILDADAALVTAIGIDHVEWLGPDRDSIGYEKAGIYRGGRPAVCADPEPPRRLLEQAHAVGAQLYRVNIDYAYRPEESGWSWWHGRQRLEALPWPALVGDHQLGNAAAALMVLAALSRRLPVAPGALRRGLMEARLAGRFQVIPGPVEWILDVTHNPHGAGALARALAARPCAGRTAAVLGMLRDKDAAAVAQVLDGGIDHWYTATLPGPRGQTGEQLAALLRPVVRRGVIAAFPGVLDACRAAAEAAVAGDRILVFGSFGTVAELLTACAGPPGLPSIDRSALYNVCPHKQ